MKITQEKILKALNHTNNCLYMGGVITGKICSADEDCVLYEDINGRIGYESIEWINLNSQNITFMNGKNGQYIEEM